MVSEPLCDRSFHSFGSFVPVRTGLESVEGEREDIYRVVLCRMYLVCLKQIF